MAQNYTLMARKNLINSKTICKNFTNHFALFLILLTQNEMSI